jgi:hypothetical protein
VYTLVLAPESAGSADPLPAFEWDLASLKDLTVQYEKESTLLSLGEGDDGVCVPHHVFRPPVRRRRGRATSHQP